MSDASGGRSTGSAGDTRRLAVLALCALALLVAAFAFPGSLGAPGPTDGPIDNETGTDRSGGTPTGEPRGPGDNPDGTGETTWAENVTGETGDGDATGGEGGGEGGASGDRIEIVPGNGSVVDGNVTREEAERVYASGCLVLLGTEPTPGARIPVYVIRGSDLATDVRVAFNGDSIGRTDGTGRVVGRVPYRTELTVSADVAGVESCRVETPESLRRNGPETSGFGHLGGTMEETTFGAAGEAKLGSTIGSADGAMKQSDPSGTVTVDGTVVVGVRGEAYPGEQVTLVAAVDGVPMRHASVTVDGRRVGETGVDGRYELTIPDDGRDEIAVTVDRGDFAGSGTIDVATLEVVLRSDAVFTLPGQEISAVTTVDGEAVADATIASDDGRVGITDARGEVALSMPTNPTTTVTARHRGLTARAVVWPLYLPLVLAVLLAVGTIAVTTRRYGRRRGVQAAAGVCAVTVAYAGYRIDGRRGLLLAVAAMALVGGSVWLYTHRRPVASGAEDAGDTLGAFMEWLAAAALRSVQGIEQLLDRVRGLAASLAGWLASTPRSAGGLLAALVGGTTVLLASLPGRLLATLRWFFRAPFALLVAIRRGAESDDAGDESAPDEARVVQNVVMASDDGDPQPISLREAWRRFARRVARDWRRRTPGEVARAAVDDGFPRESVEALTTVFRDVEYGDRRPSEERIDRAREAFRTIEADRDADGEAAD